MIRALAILLAAALAACSRQPETAPNPYVSIASAPVRVIGLAAGSSPFAEAVAQGLVRHGYAIAPVAPDAAAAAGAGAPYADFTTLRALSAQGIDGLLSVQAAQADADALGVEALERAAAASALVVSTSDGRVIAAADWRPRLGVFAGPTPLRRAGSGPILGSDLLAAPSRQLAEALAAQIAR